MIRILLLSIITLAIFSIDQNQQQEGEPPVETEYFLLEDLQIKSPLEAGKRFLGWYVDGQWKVEDKQLSFMNYEPGLFLLTNNLRVGSSKIFYDLNLNIQQTDPSKGGDIGEQSEVLAFSLSNQLFPIQTFNKGTQDLALSGYTVFVFRKREKLLFYLKIFQRQVLYNLGSIRTEDYTKDGRMYCEYDYLNKDSSVKFLLDFESGNFHVFINDHVCISYGIDKNVFGEDDDTKRTVMTIGGFSSKVSPIKMDIKSLSIYKLIVKNANYLKFHDDVSLFSSAMDFYDEKAKNNKSLSNIMLAQSKVNKEIEIAKSLVELTSMRTKSLDDIVAESIQNDKTNLENYNMFFDNEKHGEVIKKNVKQMENLMKNNNDMLSNFEKLYTGFEKVGELFNMDENLDKILDYVSDLDDLMRINEYEDFLKNLQKFSKSIQEQETPTFVNPATLIREKLSQSFQIGGFYKFFALMVLLLILGMVVMIVRRANEMLKKSAF